MRLPLLLLKVVDPAGAHFRTDAPTPSGPVYRGGVVFGPDVPGGSRQATDDELRTWGREAQRLSQAREDDTETVWQEHRDELRRGTIEILAGGVFTFTCGAGRLDCRIRRFWRGDSLLEVSRQGAAGHGSGHSLTRINRSRSQSVDTVTDYLVFEVSKLLGR